MTEPLPAAAPDKGLKRAVAAGLAVSAGCAALWAALAAASGDEAGFAGAALGAAVAYAMRRAAGGRRDARLRAAAAACATFGFLLEKFLLAAFGLIALSAAAPADPPSVPRFFVLVLPGLFTPRDALWLSLALGASWLVLRPARRI